MLNALWPRVWMREIEHRLDKLEAMDIDRRLGALGIRLGRTEEQMASVAQLEALQGQTTQAISDLSARIASIVQAGAALKAQLDDLQAKVAAGADIPDADFQAAQENLTQIQALAQSSS
jgi:hypothetical protein